MLAKRIKEYMAEKGIMQVAVANAIGISKVAMSETLKGNRRLTAEEYIAICDFLEVPYSKFTEKEEEPCLAIR